MESHNKKSFKVKLNPHITIYPVEEKMYTLQEISEQFIGESKKGGYFDDYLDYILLKEPKPRPTFKEWFEQNIK